MNQLTKILLEDILEIKNQDYIIYFDIDDTLTDYSNRLGSMIITDPETGEKRPIKASDTVDNIEFWTSAKWIPGSQQMLDFAKNNFSNVEILSAVPELSKANKELTGKRFFDDPIDGKTEWLNKNVGPIKTIWTKSGKEKAIYATPNTVLVDDKPENIKAFEQAGGIGILMDNPQNVINKLSDLLEGKNMVQEGIIDNMKAKIKDFISAIKQEGKETRDAFKLILQSAKGDITLTDEQKEQIGNQLKDVLKTIGLTAIAVLPGGVIVATLLKIFKQTHLITPSAFVNEVGEASLKPYKWEEVDQEGYFVYTRFITDSETQYDVDIKTTVFFPAGQMESLPALEIEFTAKPKGAEGSSAKIVVNKGEMYRVMATIVDIIKKYLKKSKAQAIIYSPSKKSSEENFGVQRDQLYRAFISKAIPGVTFKQSGDFVTAILPNPINEIVTDTEVICDNCGWEWPIADGGDDLYICHKCGHDNNPDLEEGTCGYDTDVKTGKKLDTPGGLEEGRPKKKDPKKGTGKKPEGSGRRLYTDEDPKDTVRIKFKTKEDIVDTLNKKQFKAKSHARQSQVINLIHQRVRAAYGKAKDPEVKARLKRALDYIESRKESSKEKTERLRKMKEASDPQAGTALPYGSGFAPIKESYQFKVSDKVYDNEDNSLITVEYTFTTPDNTYRVEFYSGEYSPKSKIFDVSFGLDKYGSKLDTFQMTGEGNALNILKTIIDIIIDFTNRFEVNKLIIDPTSEKRGKIYSMILKSLPPDILSKVELINENDPFGLNEAARNFAKEVLDKTWNLKDGFVSLSKYMIDNGMNIKPLPKIKVIKDDEKNASDLLGKTAYYDPNEKSITLFIMNRHPKDILRSFAHEMIHHEQNLNGKLKNITTTNTNEDGDLPEIEREAYEKGNMMLRNWEDKIKNV
jgi:hypothetical protein